MYNALRQIVPKQGRVKIRPPVDPQQFNCSNPDHLWGQVSDLWGTSETQVGERQHGRQGPRQAGLGDKQWRDNMEDKPREDAAFQTRRTH